MSEAMHILTVASEFSPFARTSCMGDVVTELTRALSKNGVETSVVIPKYRSIPDNIEMEKIVEGVPAPVGDRHVHFDLYKTVIKNVPVYMIDQPAYFNRDGIYHSSDGEYADNAERFIFFSRAVIELLPHYLDRPSIIHCNDWQTGLVPLYLKLYKENYPEYSRVKSLFTIHNLAYQGLFWRFDMHLTGLPWDYFTPEGIEFYGDLNLLKAGLLYSDAINTVSPTYCNEIQTTEFGCGLDGVLRKLNHKLCGILNGADFDFWNPENNPDVPCHFTVENLSGKEQCKIALCKSTGFDPDVNEPIISIISPLLSRKGLDLIEQALPTLLDRGVRVILQGFGDRNYEKIFTEIAAQRPKLFVCYQNLVLSQSIRILAGSDMFLKPSRFEPCGLNQIYAMRLGTVPIAHETGGLKDTILGYSDCNPENQTGFKFSGYSLGSMQIAISHALDVYRDKIQWKAIVRNAMQQDFSWDRSSKRYIELYKKMLAGQCNE